MAENEGTPKKAATAKKTSAPKAEKAIVEPTSEVTPKTPAKPRKAAAPKKTMATVTAIDSNREATPPPVSYMGISAQEVARLAHQYWLERGCRHGHDAEDWFRAEQELRGKAS